MSWKLLNWKRGARKINRTLRMGMETGVGLERWLLLRLCWICGASKVIEFFYFHKQSRLVSKMPKGCMSGAMVWAFTPHQCGPGSNHRAIIVQMAYSARNQVDKEPFRGRATSIASSFKRFKGNVSVNPNVLSTFTRKMLRWEDYAIFLMKQDCFT